VRPCREYNQAPEFVNLPPEHTKLPHTSA